MPKPTLTFHQSGEFLKDRGFEKATSLDQIEPNKPFIFLLPPHWRAYKKQAYHPYMSTCARVDNPLVTKMGHYRAGEKLSPQVLRGGTLAYFAIPADLDPTRAILLGGNILPGASFESKGIIINCCYLGSRELCDRHFNLSPLYEALDLTNPSEISAAI